MANRIESDADYAPEGVLQEQHGGAELGHQRAEVSRFPRVDYREPSPEFENLELEIDESADSDIDRAITESLAAAVPARVDCDLPTLSLPKRSAVDCLLCSEERPPGGLYMCRGDGRKSCQAIYCLPCVYQHAFCGLPRALCCPAATCPWFERPGQWIGSINDRIQSVHDELLSRNNALNTQVVGLEKRKVEYKRAYLDLLSENKDLKRKEKRFSELLCEFTERAELCQSGVCEWRQPKEESPGPSRTPSHKRMGPAPQQHEFRSSVDNKWRCPLCHYWTRRTPDFWRHMRQCHSPWDGSL